MRVISEFKTQAFWKIHERAKEQKLNLSEFKIQVFWTASSIMSIGKSMTCQMPRKSNLKTEVLIWQRAEEDVDQAVFTSLIR